MFVNTLLYYGILTTLNALSVTIILLARRVDPLGRKLLARFDWVIVILATANTFVCLREVVLYLINKQS